MAVIQSINKKIKMMAKKETQIEEDYTIIPIVQKKKEIWDIRTIIKFA